MWGDWLELTNSSFHNGASWLVQWGELSEQRTSVGRVGKGANYKWGEIVWGELKMGRLV